MSKRINVWVTKRKTGCVKICPACQSKNGATAKTCSKCDADLHQVKRSFMGKGFVYSVIWENPRTGRRQSITTGPDKAYASHVQGKKRQELESCEQKGITAIDYDSFVQEHLQSIEDTHSKGACYEHELVLKQFKAACHPKDLTVIDFQMLEAFRTARVADGVSPASVNKALRTLQAALEKAVRRGYIRVNPFKGNRKALSIKEPEKPIHTLEPADFKALYGACQNDRWRGIVTVGYYGGLRIGEILALEWSDIDFDRRMLHVRNKADHRTKSGKNRVVPMAAETVSALQALQVDRFKSTLVFNTLVNSRMGNNVQRDFREIVIRAELVDKDGKPRFTLHDLRRTFCTNLLGTGADVKSVQTLAGHANVTTTLKHYAGVTAKKMAEAIDRLSKLG